MLKWFKNTFSKPQSAMEFYKLGMAQAQDEDHAGAIENYSAAIEIPDIGPELKAMVLYNRALVFAAKREPSQAIDDLNAVLKMRNLDGKIKTAATQKLDRIKRRTGIN